MKKNRPEFYAFYKDVNSGEIKKYEVLYTVFNDLLDSRERIKKSRFYILDKKGYNKIPITTKEHLQEFIRSEFFYHFGSKCEWEMIVIDWPYRPTVENSRPKRIDVYDQLEINLPTITDLVWNYIENKIKK